MSWKVTDRFVTRTHPDKEGMISLSEKEALLNINKNSKIKQGKQNNKQKNLFSWPSYSSDKKWWMIHS